MDERAGLLEYRFLQQWDHVFCPRRVHSPPAQENLLTPNHEEEIFQLRRHISCSDVVLVLGDMRKHFSFDPIGKLAHRLEVITGRRLHDTDHQISIALGQVLQGRQQPPRQRYRPSHQRSDDAESDLLISHHAPGNANDAGDEHAPELVRKGHA